MLADIIMQASTSVDLELEDAEKVMRLIDALEDLDDVQKVHSNAEISDEVMANL
jgi:transcriptional/translational regulatory protein YebC/TACO1